MAIQSGNMQRRHFSRSIEAVDDSSRNSGRAAARVHPTSGRVGECVEKLVVCFDTVFDTIDVTSCGCEVDEKWEEGGLGGSCVGGGQRPW